MTPDIPTLKRRADFVRVARAGQKWVTPGMIVQKHRRPETDAEALPAGVVRVGFTTSRRVGKAVARNRARRRLRAAAREILPHYAEAGCDYVIIGRTETVTRPFTALLDDLTTAIRRLRVPASRRPRPAGRRGRGPAACRAELPR